MPIRINLKELFPADAQEITIDKINFNFNKLLALGVGEPGPIGFSGTQGSAGPIGGVGSQGTRGSTWIVDAGSPTITTGLLDGDLYLDSTALAVWQWDAATSTWNFLFDISAIVQNYLNSSPSPFVRGFGDGSPNDQRFILFGKRDGLYTDDIQQNPASLNDVLFLTNYDEKLITNPPVLIGSPDTDDFYNALLTVSVDQRNGDPLRRSHIELGSLYGTLSPVITPADENFKMRYDRVTGSIHPGLIYYNQQTLSLDINSLINPGSRTFSSVFAFQSPKYLPTSPPNPSINGFSNVYIGSRYGLDEVAPSATSTSTLADGIVIATGGSGANIGLATGYSITGVSGQSQYFNFASPQDHLMLDAIGTSSSIFLNDFTYQNGGNLVQLGTTPARLQGQAGIFVLSGAAVVPQTAAMAVSGNKVISVIGKKDVTNLQTIPQFYSTYGETVIENVNAPVFHLSRNYTTAINPSSVLDFAGISDIAVSGDYMYAVKCLSLNNTTSSIGLGRATFQTTQLNQELDQLPVATTKLIASSVTPPQYDCLHRIKLRGNLAVVTSNALPVTPSVTNLGGNLVSGNTYDGRVLLLDITSPSTVIEVGSVVSTKQQAGSGASTRSAFMDMDVVDDVVFTLTWEQTPASPTTANVAIKVDAFSIKGDDVEPTSPPAVVYKASTFSVTNGTMINASALNVSQYTSLSKVGAIAANKKYVYAGYSIYSTGTGNYTPVIRLYEIRGGIGTTGLIPIPANLSFSYSGTITLDPGTPGAQITEVNKIHQVGGSLYVLTNSASNGSYLFKIDVSNPAAPFQVWSKNLGAAPQYYSNFVMVGKNIYAINTGIIDPANTISLSNITSIDIDGVYTGAAHIESLRSEELTVTQNFSVGNNATIHNELNVGGRAEIVGELGVGARLRLAGGAYFTGALSTNPGGANLNLLQSIPTFYINGDQPIVNIKDTSGASPRLILSSASTDFLTIGHDGSNNSVFMNLDSSSDLEINTASNKQVRIKSVGNSNLILETGGGTTNNNIRIYDGNSSVATNEALRIVTFPASTYVEIGAKNNRTLYTTTSGADNIIQATSANVNINADKLVVNTSQNYSVLTSPLTVSANSDIIMSGLSTLSVSGGTATMLWNRVGNVVTVSGELDSTLWSESSGNWEYTLSVPVRTTNPILYCSGTASILGNSPTLGTPIYSSGIALGNAVSVNSILLRVKVIQFLYPVTGIQRATYSFMYRLA